MLGCNWADSNPNYFAYGLSLVIDFLMLKEMGCLLQIKRNQ